MGYFISSLIIIFIIGAVIKVNIFKDKDKRINTSIKRDLIENYEFSDEFLSADDVDYIDWDNYKDDLF